MSQATLSGSNIPLVSGVPYSVFPEQGAGLFLPEKHPDLHKTLQGSTAGHGREQWCSSWKHSKCFQKICWLGFLGHCRVQVPVMPRAHPGGSVRVPVHIRAKVWRKSYMKETFDFVYSRLPKIFWEFSCPVALTRRYTWAFNVHADNHRGRHSTNICYAYVLVR